MKQYSFLQEFNILYNALLSATGLEAALLIFNIKLEDTPKKISTRARINKLYLFLIKKFILIPPFVLYL